LETGMLAAWSLQTGRRCLTLSDMEGKLMESLEFEVWCGIAGSPEAGAN
jgi:hypothetical protein